jgi:phosphatidylinositol alpha-1,6-mannosyltransferase
LQSLVCESAQLVIANSEYTRRLTLRAAPHARVVAVPLGVDHVRFTPGDRTSARAKFGIAQQIVIATVSRLSAYKGHDMILRALAALPPATRHRFQYIIAGKGQNQEPLRAQVGALGLTEGVRFLGYVPERDLADLYRACDLFVMCTHEFADRPEVEGFGMAFLEAQACGIPAVGTRTGGIPDAIREGEGGWLIEQNDVAALCEILMRLAATPEEFRNAGYAARRRVERECTWEHYTNRFLDVLTGEGITLV